MKNNITIISLIFVTLLSFASYKLNKAEKRIKLAESYITLCKDDNMSNFTHTWEDGTVEIFDNLCWNHYMIKSGEWKSPNKVKPIDKLIEFLTELKK